MYVCMYVYISGISMHYTSDPCIPVQHQHESGVAMYENEVVAVNVCFVHTSTYIVDAKQQTSLNHLLSEINNVKVCINVELVCYYAEKNFYKMF